jgi:hypothetical protein
VHFRVAGLSGHVWELAVPARTTVEDVIAQQLARRQAHGFRPAPLGGPATVNIQYPPECFATAEGRLARLGRGQHAPDQWIGREGHGLPPVVDHSSELTSSLRLLIYPMVWSGSGRRWRRPGGVAAWSSPSSTSRPVPASSSCSPVTYRVDARQVALRSRATAATAWASLPTRQQTSARARLISTARRQMVAGACRAGRLSTAPDPLAPQERHRTAAEGQVATRRPPPQRQGPQSRQGRAAWRLTHHCADPPGPPVLPGLRRSVVMSDLSEGGDRPGRVASVVAEGSGEVDGPARLSTPMTRLRRHAIVCGPVPVRSWEASSAKVTSRTWCRPFSNRCADCAYG